MKLSVLLSLFTGCAEKPATAPGVSVKLAYPILLAGEKRLVVKDDELSLTTTSVATGLTFPLYTMLDSNGAQYSIRKVTEFEKKSGFLDMGTSHFRVFLWAKATGKPSLTEAKAMVKDVASGASQYPGKQTASQAIAGAESIPQLIEICRKSWEWQ